MSLYTSIASNQTHDDLGATRTVSNNSVHVYGFHITNDSGAGVVVDLTDVDDTVIDKIGIPDEETFESDVEWLANNGLKLAIPAGANANVFFTVFHSNVSGAA